MRRSGQLIGDNEFRTQTCGLCYNASMITIQRDGDTGGQRDEEGEKIHAKSVERGSSLRDSQSGRLEFLQETAQYLLV